MRTRLLVPALLALAALALTGCVDNADSEGAASDAAPTATTGTATAEVAADPALAARLPDAVADRGVLRIGTYPDYAPNEFKDADGRPTGWDLELASAIAARLGLAPQITVSKFENIIPGIAGGRYDLGASSFTDTVERQKQVDFVDYYRAGIAWAAPAGATVDPENACGLKVGVNRGTTEDLDEVPAKSAACTAAGKKPIQLMRFDSQDLATNALALGQIDAMSADSPITAYAIHQLPDTLAAAGRTFDVAPYGLATVKGSEMTGLVKDALHSLIADGTYGRILDSWGVGDGAVTSARVNGAS